MGGGGGYEKLMSLITSLIPEDLSPNTYLTGMCRYIQKETVASKRPP